MYRSKTNLTGRKFIFIFFAHLFLVLVVSASETEPAQNIGSPVNTGFNEFAPSLSADGKTMVFNSKRENSLYQDLYISERDAQGKWSEPQPLNRLNSPYNDETPVLSPDGSLLIFASDRDESFSLPRDESRNVRISFDLYWARKINGQWGLPRKIPSINSIQHERSPSLSADGNFLYYMSWPFGQADQMTFYRSRIVNNKSVADREQIPFPVDGKYHTLGIQPAHDKNGFYFASKLPDSLGEWDIYFISFQNGEFGSPQNLGPSVNSAASEIYFSIIKPAKAGGDHTIFFCSNRPGGAGQFDIYGANLPTPQAARFQVLVTDAITNKPILTEIIIKEIERETGGREQRQNTDEKGMAGIEIQGNQEIQLDVLDNRYLPLNLNLGADELRKILEEHKGVITLKLSPLQKDAKFLIHNIHFELNSAQLLPASKKYLLTLAEYLKKNLRLKFEIIGHTDLNGNSEANQILSEKRAQSVKNFLIQNGIDENRLFSKGAGMTKPLVNKISIKTDRLNRRTEFRIVEN